MWSKGPCRGRGRGLEEVSDQGGTESQLLSVTALDILFVQSPVFIFLPCLLFSSGWVVQ